LPTLHRTLEHAITLTIRLGFRYIWIDSVCINQEDSDDKQIQIAMMKDIYRGSLATLVALSADDANSGM
ncbi:heterokaryon incompatibility, partial [Dissoconium aciculare CBS 342.82]|uniref:Heterokaryon incompatibility n=1 Tax=Dissoconium aciculare CBS 342.82 TaxID=1314786 RepID=A0A6J3M1G0_9PEZI